MSVSRSYLAEGILPAGASPACNAAVVIVFAWLAPHFLSVPNFVTSWSNVRPSDRAGE